MKNIHIIENLRDAEPEILQGIYSLRHKVFSEDLGWVNPNPIGIETDIYDTLDTTHFAYLSPQNEVVGCFRIVSTVGPYMLRDVFPQLMGTTELPNTPSIWEISRFAVAPHCRALNLSRITSELLLALFEYAQKKNIHAIVGVTDTVFEKLLRRAGLYSTRYAPPRQIGNCLAVAGYAEVNDENLSTLRQRFARLTFSSAPQSNDSASPFITEAGVYTSISK